MLPSHLPHLVLVASLVLYSIVGDFGRRAIFPAPLSLDDLNRPAIFRKYGSFFSLLTILPPVATFAVFVWSFMHASWWEPPLSLVFGLYFVGPLIVRLIRTLG
ncbi:MAG: hypothetical protein ACK5Y6_07915, partial [Pseudomonadota bacterium]